MRFAAHGGVLILLGRVSSASRTSSGTLIRCRHSSPFRWGINSPGIRPLGIGSAECESAAGYELVWVCKPGVVQSASPPLFSGVRKPGFHTAPAVDATGQGEPTADGCSPAA